MAEQWTIGKVLAWTTTYFHDKNIDNPRLDAEVLLAHVLHSDRVKLYVDFHKPLLTTELTAYRQLITQRATHVPVAYLTGHKGFMRLDFMVTPDVLIPRPETELLVEEAVAFCKQRRQMDGERGHDDAKDHTISREMEKNALCVVADIGTGSGAIVLSLLHALPDSYGIAVDISEPALRVARHNADQFGLMDRVDFRLGDLTQPLAGQQVDLITANLPYISTKDMQQLPPDVRREPQLALQAGADGLDLYRRLILGVAEQLKPGGQLLMEIGMDQERPIRDLLEHSHQLQYVKTIYDYAHMARVIVAEQVAAVATKKMEG